QGSAAIAYRGPGTWRVLEPRGRPGGRVASTGVAGANAELTFVGTGLAWTTAVGPRHGLAEIRVDGRRVGSVDTYAREPGLAVHRIHGLAPGTHTIRIVVLGRRAARAEGTIVAVDRVRVLSQPARRGGGQLPAAHDPGFPEPWGPGRAPARPVIDPR
ncbi:MAG TPA: hypothetical protein VE669_08160, partial [Actinomycetota bacterium]|nr:hypothetical protein [Actinomycetota bacterium]